PSSSASHAHPGPRGRSSSMLSQYSGFTDAGEEYVFPDPAPPHHQPQPQPQPQPHAHSNHWPPAQPPPPHASAGAVHALFAEDRKESESSGSVTNGSNGSNSPRPQARPFVPAGKVGTIGPPGKGRERAPQQGQSSPGAVGSGR
ncbi:hypothetical protein LTR53_008227, partial [Teratosphaeriaceae sp. CCFEE 6253]